MTNAERKLKEVCISPLITPGIVQSLHLAPGAIFRAAALKTVGYFDHIALLFEVDTDAKNEIRGVQIVKDGGDVPNGWLFLSSVLILNVWYCMYLAPHPLPERI